MCTKNIINSSTDFEELKVVAITSQYVIVANLKGQVVGIISKKNEAEYSIGPIKAKLTDKNIPVIVASPGSYHSKLHQRPCYFEKGEGIWWGECRQNKEIVALKSNRTYHLESVTVACNADHYAHLPIYEEV